MKDTFIYHLKVFYNLHIAFRILWLFPPLMFYSYGGFFKKFSHVEKQFDERYVIIICNDSTQGTNNDQIPHTHL